MGGGAPSIIGADGDNVSACWQQMVHIVKWMSWFCREAGPIWAFPMVHGNWEQSQFNVIENGVDNKISVDEIHAAKVWKTNFWNYLSQGNPETG